MLTTTRISETRIDMTMDGPLDSSAMAASLDDLLHKSEGMAHGQAMMIVPDFEWPTGGAMLVELTYLPLLFKLIHRIDRLALLCDVKWIRTAGEIEGAVLPGIEIKSFPLKDRDAAEAWLAAS